MMVDGDGWLMVGCSPFVFVSVVMLMIVRGSLEEGLRDTRRIWMEA